MECLSAITGIRKLDGLDKDRKAEEAAKADAGAEQQRTAEKQRTETEAAEKLKEQVNAFRLAKPSPESPSRAENGDSKSEDKKINLAGVSADQKNVAQKPDEDTGNKSKNDVGKTDTPKPKPDEKKPEKLIQQAHLAKTCGPKPA